MNILKRMIFLTVNLFPISSHLKNQMKILTTYSWKNLFIQMLILLISKWSWTVSQKLLLLYPRVSKWLIFITVVTASFRYWNEHFWWLETGWFWRSRWNEQRWGNALVTFSFGRQWDGRELLYDMIWYYQYVHEFYWVKVDSGEPDDSPDVLDEIARILSQVQDREPNTQVRG